MAPNLLSSNLSSRGASEEEIRKAKDHFVENLLKKRNEIWLERIISAHQQEANKEMFIAAGLAHFTEDHNLLDMLKIEGFRIKRYSVGCVAEESY